MSAHRISPTAHPVLRHPHLLRHNLGLVVGRLHKKAIGVFLIFIALTGCDSTELERWDRAFRITISSTEAVESALAVAVEDGALTPDEVNAILRVSGEVRTVALEARVALSGIKEISPEDRLYLVKVIGVILEAVDFSENSLHLIPNVKVRKAIQVSLITLKVALNSLV